MEYVFLSVGMNKWIYFFKSIFLFIFFLHVKQYWELTFDMELSDKLCKKQLNFNFIFNSLRIKNIFNFRQKIWVKNNFYFCKK